MKTSPAFVLMLVLGARLFGEPPPEGMVKIPEGRVLFGAGESEKELARQTAEELRRAARRTLAGRADTRALAESAPLAEALKQAVADAEADYAAAGGSKTHKALQKRILELNRAGWLEPVSERDRLAERLFTLRRCAAMLSLADSIPHWLGDETPRTAVDVPAFYLDTHEVTVAQYQAYCEATGAEMPWTYRAAATGESASGSFPEPVHPSFMHPQSPVTGLTHGEAAAYAAWAGKRLPTEIEWAHAARAGDGRVFAWGDEPWDGTQANLAEKALVNLNPRYADRSGHVDIDDGYPALAPVGSFPPNPWGLFDMTGNAAEWVDGMPFYQEFLNRKLAGELPEDFESPGPKDPHKYGHTRDEFQPIRGGGYNNMAFDARISRRYGPPVMHAEPERGFRCAKDIP